MRLAIVDVMTVEGRRERKKERTREDLVRAAIKLFEERGYEGTTVDDIVEEADYSRATFFRHFPTKEDVVFIDLPERVAALRQVHAAPATVSPWELAREAVTEQVLGFTAFAPEAEAACIRLWFTEPALHRRYLELVVEAEDHLAAFLQSRLGDDPTTLLRCRILAIAIIGVGRAVLLQGLTDEAKVREALADGFATIERGVLAVDGELAPGPRKRRSTTAKQVRATV
jgi:AcrR family transcriptional regulator